MKAQWLLISLNVVHIGNYTVHNLSLFVDFTMITQTPETSRRKTVKEEISWKFLTSHYY